MPIRLIFRDWISYIQIFVFSKNKYTLIYQLFAILYAKNEKEIMI